MASFQSVCNTTASSPSAVKLCRSQSARICDSATWIFSRSFMIDDITRAVELASKKCAS